MSASSQKSLLDFPDRPQFSGFMKPCGVEGEVFNLEFRGEIPADIDGTFYRVMPDPQFPPFIEDDPVSHGTRIYLWYVRARNLEADDSDSGSTATGTSARSGSRMGGSLSSSDTCEPRSLIVNERHNGPFLVSWKEKEKSRSRKEKASRVLDWSARQVHRLT